MNIAGWAIENPLYPWIIALVCLIGGIVGIETVGRLEDPEFPVKNAFVITAYPGASAVETEEEITDVIEAALQELPYIDTLTSKSLAGRSEVQIEIDQQYGDADMPQIWDELRRRIGDAAARLPPGASVPNVRDDFGDIYGVLYAVNAAGFSDAEIRDMSRFLETGLKSVPKVGKVRNAGLPEEALFIELDHQRLVSLGIPLDAVFQSIGAENRVMQAGSVEHSGRRFRVTTPSAYDGVQSISEMRIGRPGTFEFVRLAEIATVTRERVEQPSQIIHHNGEQVFTLAVSVRDGENVVKVGQAVDEKMRHMVEQLPVGVSYVPIYRQHTVVQASLEEFLKNLALSVLTVVAALCVFMGWRAGAVVGSVLFLTVFGTIMFMALLGIDLQRISLGALMIAMGMLVDNAIVVTEGMITGVQRGRSVKEAASLSVKRTQFALLGATIIGIAAFGPIGLANDGPGYFLRALFQVVAISLLLSWILAVTVCPLFGSYLLKAQERPAQELYASWGYVPYRHLIGFSLRNAWLTTALLVAVTLSCFWGFGYVKQGFFPTNNSPLVYVDLRLPQGTDIRSTISEVEKLDTLVSKDPDVVSVTSFIGAGSTRFTSTVRPEQPDPSYGHMIVRLADVTLIDGALTRFKELIERANTDLEVTTRRSEFSSSGNFKIVARFSGPDEAVLRSVAEKALTVFLDHDLIERRTDWRQQEITLVPHFSEARARQAGVSLNDVSQALAFVSTGVQVGLFRDGDKLLPIIARAPQSERADTGGIRNRQVWSSTEQSYVPLAQVISEIRLESESAVIHRRGRVRTISALANAPVGQNTTRAFNQIRDEVEAIPLPPGYSLEWGGEYEGSKEARDTLSRRIPTALGIMLFVTILMFGKLKQPFVIWLTVPMIVCGVVVSLLVTDLSFTFPAFLGLLSLSGMLIKNCIVLVDEIDKRLAEDTYSIETIAAASVSRLRPVMLAAGTTIAGMSPLLWDAFFREMAVVIMGGLAFATLLTLIAVPVFYRIAMTKKLSDATPAALSSEVSLDASS